MNRSGSLRILQLLTHHRIHSGGAIQAFLLSRELVRRGHQVTFAVRERRGECDPDTRTRVEGIGCIYQGHDLSARRSVSTLRRALVEKDGTTAAFDVVHLHREDALRRYLQAARRAPPIAAIANIGTSKPPDRGQTLRLNSRHIDRVVVVAAALKDLLVCAANVEPTKIEVILGAYDEARFHDGPKTPRASLGVKDDAPLVGVIANLDPKKGHRVFLRAAAIVCQRRPDARFLFAGKGERERLLSLAADAGVPEEAVIPLGFVDDIPGLLRALDVSVSASTHGEGLTGAVRESLAMGTPTVCTAIAGNVELVHHKETGLAVRPGDPTALAAAILECLDDPAAARARAARGQALVLGQLTAARRAERMEALYRDAIHWRDVQRGPLERFLFPDPEAPAADTAADTAEKTADARAGADRHPHGVGLDRRRPEDES